MIISMEDAFTKNVARLEQSLDAGLFDGAQAVAFELRNEGVSQVDLLAIFDEVRARHSDNPDERKFDACADVMDLISGWCHPSKAMYPGTDK